jgi:hypothetical protein
MKPYGEGRYTAFLGQGFLARGSVEEVVATAKEHLDAGTEERLAIFDDAEARVHDIDFRGSPEDVLARLEHHPLLSGRRRPEGGSGEEPKRSPGRPRLGVVSGEVTLLPRHWAWLRSRKGGASATIRRLVDEARRKASSGDRTRQTQEAAYRFMSDMAPDLPGFEEASRALFSGRIGDFFEEIREWPADLRMYLEELLKGAGQPPADAEE